jgi:hypothetical protein
MIGKQKPEKKEKPVKEEPVDERTPEEIAQDDEMEAKCTELTGDKRWAVSPFKKGFKAGVEYQQSL